MTWFDRWCEARAHHAILTQLARIEGTINHMDNTLDDIKANEVKMHAKIDRLLALAQAAPAGTFTPEQQQEINDIAADQAAALAAGETPTTGA